MEAVAREMLRCSYMGGSYITKANMKQMVPIPKAMWKKYKKYVKCTNKTEVYHIIGQLIKARDCVEDAMANEDAVEEKIYLAKEKHYRKTVYIYLVSGLRPDEPKPIITPS